MSKSPTTIEESPVIRREDLDRLSFDDIAPGRKLSPLTPGEVLHEEFLRPLGLSARGLAAELGIPGNRISAIVNGTRGITAETAILLGRRFDTTPQFWMNLQVAHDLAVAAADMTGE